MIKVSIITPTKNRKKFCKNIINNFYRQDYPIENMELIIGEDGNDNIKELLPKNDNIKYYRFENITLGEKRNKLCELSLGDIIIFMDDDDYYPSKKVSEVVRLFDENKDVELIGSSILYVYYVKFDKILKFGPYLKYHTTCGALSIKKSYFNNHKFPNIPKSEERVFLDNYKNKLIQANPMNSILVIAHDLNTVSKEKFYNNNKITNLKLSDFGLNNEEQNYYKLLYNNN